MAKQKKQAGNTARRKRNTDKYARRSKRNRFGTFCIVLQTVASIVLMIVLYLLGMLPMKYLTLIAAFLFLLWCITLNSQVARKKRGVPGKIFSLFMTLVLLTGSYYVAQANDMIGKITSGGYKVDKMVVAVRADDPAEVLEDAADYIFGVQFNKGADNMQAAVTDIQQELGTDVVTEEYDSIQEQAVALRDGEVDAIVYNQAYTSLMEEAVPDFEESVKVIYSHEIRIQLEFGGASDNSITKEPFTVYISGIDVYGDIRDKPE